MNHPGFPDGCARLIHMAFTEHEKARIRHFMGYPSFSALSASIQLGVPAAAQPLFILEDQFARITEEGVQAARIDLCNCEAIEAQLGDARQRMATTSVGNITMNPRETAQLRGELAYWVTRLADDLGSPVNPYSRAEFFGTGGINGRVQG